MRSAIIYMCLLLSACEIRYTYTHADIASFRCSPEQLTQVEAELKVCPIAKAHDGVGQGFSATHCFEQAKRSLCTPIKSLEVDDYEK